MTYNYETYAKIMEKCREHLAEMEEECYNSGSSGLCEGLIEIEGLPVFHDNTILFEIFRGRQSLEESVEN